MDILKEIQNDLSSELNRIKQVKIIDEYVEQIGIVNETINETINGKLNKFRDITNDFQNLLNDINKKSVMIIECIKEKYEAGKNESSNANKTIKSEDDFEESIELEKSKISHEYYTKSLSLTEVIESIKISQKTIEEIIKSNEDSKAYVTLCEKKLNETKKKLEDLRIQKEQEEKAKLEEEQKEIERLKEEARLEEIRKKEMERMQKELEQNEKAGIHEKDKFNITKLELTQGEFSDNSIGCYIRTRHDCVISANDLIIELIDPVELKCDFDATEEIISNIIKISASANQQENYQFEQAFSVILPHNLARAQPKEPCIFQYSTIDESWTPLQTQDSPTDDVDKSVGANARFVEAIFCELPLILTVTSLPRVENVQYGKKGCNWSSSTDQRVGMIIPQSAVKVNLQCGITILPFESVFIQDLKNKTKGTVVDNVYSFTHIFKMESIKRLLLKPVTISMPLPLKQAVKSDSNSLPGLSLSSDKSSKVSFGSSNMDEVEENIKLFTLDSNRNWIEFKGCEIEMERKEAMKFDLNEFKNQTFIGLRTKLDASNDQITRSISMILDHLKIRQVKIITSYHSTESNLVSITICPISKLDKQLRLLREDGYNEDDMSISHDIEVKEREQLALRFRGNVRVVGKEMDDYVYTFRYCSQLKNRIKFNLEVVDKYAQRSKSRYQGFVTLTMSKWTKKPKPKQEGETRKGPPPMMEVEEIIPIYEVVLEIPKINVSQVGSRSELDQEFHFTSQDTVTEDFIKNLSKEINQDWKSLANALNVPKYRIEELTEMAKNSKNINNNKLAYEVLKLWIIHLPVSKNKEIILKKALSKINRDDCANLIVVN